MKIKQSQPNEYSLFMTEDELKSVLEAIQDIDPARFSKNDKEAFKRYKQEYNRVTESNVPH